MGIIFGAVAGCIQRKRRNILHLPGAMVVAGHHSTVVARDHHVVVARVGRNVSAFTTTYVIPVALGDHALVVVRSDAHRAVVLLRAIEIVGERVVGDHVIELRRRLVVLPRPGFAAIHRNGHATVVAVHDALWIRGIDPQSVMVAMRRRQQIEGHAAVARAK